MPLVVEEAVVNRRCVELNDHGVASLTLTNRKEKGSLTTPKSKKVPFSVFVSPSRGDRPMTSAAPDQRGVFEFSPPRKIIEAPVSRSEVSPSPMRGGRGYRPCVTTEMPLSLNRGPLLVSEVLLNGASVEKVRNDTGLT